MVNGGANCPTTAASPVLINTDIRYSCSSSDTYFDVTPTTATDNRTVDVTCGASGTFEYPTEWPISCVDHTVCPDFLGLGAEFAVTYPVDRGGEHWNGDVAEYERNKTHLCVCVLKLSACLQVVMRGSSLPNQVHKRHCVLHN